EVHRRFDSEEPGQHCWMPGGPGANPHIGRIQLAEARRRHLCADLQRSGCLTQRAVRADTHCHETDHDCTVQHATIHGCPLCVWADGLQTHRQEGTPTRSSTVDLSPINQCAGTCWLSPS